MMPYNSSHGHYKHAVCEQVSAELGIIDYSEGASK